ncbi:hypothetical protein COV11_00410 [Candidatus Woesearchaeota archaeon CG10_big_fil_rev_8_21_14_0_10_30_7]|nr:MAG: hypothetical protein COV11_00410 [Candidatus Woesearchaeota archaeon CG10_big_fil_rev_8_21_14_0_10_30_7]
MRGLEILLLPLACLGELSKNRKIYARSQFYDEINNFLLGTLTGAATTVAVIGGGVLYGYSSAKGNPLPGMGYAIGGAAASSFFSGYKIGFPEKLSGGFLGTTATAALGVASYGAGNLIGGLN